MDYEIEDFELENELDIEDIEIRNEYGLEEFGVDVAYVGSGVKQIYWGANEPTDQNILVWIDTSVPPITGTQLITSDNKGFYTSDNEAFILKEELKSQLVTSDNKMFITVDDKEFILKDAISLFTSDDKEFIEANNKNFVLKEGN